MLFLMKITDADDAELDSTVCIVYHERREKERGCPDNCLFSSSSHRISRYAAIMYAGDRMLNAPRRDGRHVGNIVTGVAEGIDHRIPQAFPKRLVLQLFLG